MNPAPANVLVRGSGVAVATAVRLLREEGFGIAVPESGVRASAPVVMLGESALALLRDVFGRTDLLAGGAPISRRIVAWGDADPVTLPHKAIVMSGAALGAELAMPVPTGPEGAPFFTLHATSPSTDVSVRRFGRREAMAASVDLTPDADAQACLVEATPSGWLFLIPCGDGKAWLLGVGGVLDVLLGQSRLVAAHVHNVSPATMRFETAPRLLETLAGEDWLACGTDAIAFDPICGDGTAQAAREGILAAAVIAGLRDAGPDSRESAALIGHYQSMLIAAMRRHLQISLPFYREGGTSPWWQEQADAIAEGHAWCTARLGAMPEPRFVLRGTRLVARELAA